MGQELARIRDERLEQPILGGREMEILLGHLHELSPQIDVQITEADDRGASLGLRTTSSLGVLAEALAVLRGWAPRVGRALAAGGTREGGLPPRATLHAALRIGGFLDVVPRGPGNHRPATLGLPGWTAREAPERGVERRGERPPSALFVTLT